MEITSPSPSIAPPHILFVATKASPKRYFYAVLVISNEALQQVFLEEQAPDYIDSGDGHYPNMLQEHTFEEMGTDGIDGVLDASQEELHICNDRSYWTSASCFVNGKQYGALMQDALFEYHNTIAVENAYHLHDNGIIPLQVKTLLEDTIAKYPKARLHPFWLNEGEWLYEAVYKLAPKFKQIPLYNQGMLWSKEKVREEVEVEIAIPTNEGDIKVKRTKYVNTGKVRWFPWLVVGLTKDYVWITRNFEVNALTPQRHHKRGAYKVPRVDLELLGEHTLTKASGKRRFNIATVYLQTNIDDTFVYVLDEGFHRQFYYTNNLSDRAYKDQEQARQEKRSIKNIHYYRTLADLEEAIRQARSKLQQSHPDKGGLGGETFTRAKQELDNLKYQMKNRLEEGAPQ